MPEAKPRKELHLAGSTQSSSQAHAWAPSGLSNTWTGMGDPGGDLLHIQTRPGVARVPTGPESARNPSAKDRLQCYVHRPFPGHGERLVPSVRLTPRGIRSQTLGHRLGLPQTERSQQVLGLPEGSPRGSEKACP